MTINCLGCETEHERTPNIKHQKHPITGQEGWFCDKWFAPSRHEFIPDSIKEERKKHWKSTLQPHRAGYPSKEFIEEYPDRAKEMFTPTEIRKAKNVWKDI